MYGMVFQCVHCGHSAKFEDYQLVDRFEFFSDPHEMTDDDIDKFESDPPYRCPSCLSFVLFGRC